jgi:hypothetical protein
MTWSLRHVRRALAVPASVAILVGAAATATGLTSVQHVAATTCATLGPSPQTFAFTGAEQCFVVPANVTSIHAVLVGGIGGTGYAVFEGDTGGAGGHGAQVTADVAVIPGQTSYVEVAGNGDPGFEYPAFVNGDNGGFNGGASGGGSGFVFDAQAAGGGGATDLRTVGGTLTSCDGGINYEGGASSLASRLLVAGGGGGGGNPADASSLTGGSGGAGGTAPAAGGGTANSGAGGGAGTQSGGGAGGAGGTGAGAANDGTNGDNGTAGCGGTGGDPAENDAWDSGGGGGGGYYGGGGGGGGPCPISESGCGGTAVVNPGTRTSAIAVVEGGGGGGAGSNFHDPTTTSNFSAVTDAPTGGSATISYVVATPTPTVAAITVPATGGSGGGVTPSLGLLVLIGGVILLIPVLAGRRRPAP